MSSRSHGRRASCPTCRVKSLPGQVNTRVRTPNTRPGRCQVSTKRHRMMHRTNQLAMNQISRIRRPPLLGWLLGSPPIKPGQTIGQQKALFGLTLLTGSLLGRALPRHPVHASARMLGATYTPNDAVSWRDSRLGKMDGNYPQRALNGGVVRPPQARGLQPSQHK